MKRKLGRSLVSLAKKRKKLSPKWKVDWKATGKELKSRVKKAYRKSKPALARTAIRAVGGAADGAFFGSVTSKKGQRGKAARRGAIGGALLTPVMPFGGLVSGITAGTLQRLKKRKKIKKRRKR